MPHPESSFNTEMHSEATLLVSESAERLNSAFLRSSLQGDPAAAESTVRRHLSAAMLREPGKDVVAYCEADPASRIGPAVVVVTDDMPLIVDALRAAVEAEGARVRHVLHPVLPVARTTDGALQGLAAEPDSAAQESWVQLELMHKLSPSRRDAVIGAAQRMLRALRRIQCDTPSVLRRCHDVAQTLAAAPEGALPPGGGGDDADLLLWMASDNVVFLGYEYRSSVRPLGHPYIERPDDPTRLGLFEFEQDRARTPGADEAVATLATRVTVARSREYSWFGGSLPRVHVIGVPALQGTDVVGEHRFLGIFAVTALHENILDIPVLASLARSVVSSAGCRLESHTGQLLLELMQDYPRSEMFGIDADSLQQMFAGVVENADRKLPTVFVPPTRSAWIDALVYLPRERYSSAACAAICSALQQEFPNAEITDSVRMTARDLALVHIAILSAEGEPHDASNVGDVRDRTKALVENLSRDFGDELRERLHDSAISAAAVDHYLEGLPESYKRNVDPARAARDIVRVDALGDGEVDIHVCAEAVTVGADRRLTMYTAGKQVSLSEVLPILHSMGFLVIDEQPYQIHSPDGVIAWLYDFGLRITGPVADGTVQPLEQRVRETFLAVWTQASEGDAFNALIIRAGLTWTETTALRVYAKYLQQVGFPYSYGRVADVLCAHSDIAGGLVQLFGARLHPDHADGETAHELTHRIARAVDEVEGLDDDRILRAFLNLVLATARTNFFRWTNPATMSSTAVSLKLGTRELTVLPKPRPHYEIFVYSPRLEGVHLRFGLVARGGLRWSERLEDYRTEILGLVKAQEVKNAVIVPVGAKGGFVVKRLPPVTGDAVRDRAALRENGIECYRSFISALLDVTDTIDSATRAVIGPASVVRHDGDDPYLVVAADKGTATFSDEANSVATEYGFWLGDAFASGGSIGFDHKAMGITAKGAWESVKRHFAELGVDPQTTDFTVVGIGDMSGDVFGNGMLLSRHIKLVAAFDHRHVFLDPNPDAASSFGERNRLFAMPRSSWSDYDLDLVSEGGGVFARSMKTIPISNQVGTALGLGADVQSLSPQDLIRAILRAPVDLLWNGGIGTYVKAREEAHPDVGDKANDPVRVNAGDVRARVIVEGGNLGVTGLGRIEYARAGGRINSDAIDNSAGVDCSDHEVNIKILLDDLLSSGAIDRPTRNQMLLDMADEVEQLVLADNASQNELIGTSRNAAPGRIRVHARQIRMLESRHGLDRALEFLPSDEELSLREQRGQGLSSPELSTLAAHVKLALKKELLATESFDNDIFAGRMLSYFPAALRRDYPDAILNHPLRREILGTIITNEVVDSGGVSYVYRLGEELGASGSDAVRAFIAASAILDLPRIYADIRRWGPGIVVAERMMAEVRRVLDRLSRWLLNRRPQPIAIGAEITRYRREVQRLLPQVPNLMRAAATEAFTARVSELVALGASLEHAETVAGLLHGFCAMDIVDIADVEGRSIDEVAELYYLLNAHLSVDEVLTAISRLDDSERWNALARLALRDDVYASMRSLCIDVLSGSPDIESAREKIDDWELNNRSRLARARGVLSDLFVSELTELASLSVAARQLQLMVGRAQAGRPSTYA